MMKPVSHWSRLVLAALLGLALAGCSSNQDYDPTRGWSAERLYEEAKQAMDNRSFQEAIDLFEKLEARYPFGPLARQAQLDIAYSYYQFGQHDAAIAAADRFIKLHPAHEGAAYAHYLRGLVRYNHSRGFINDIVARDMAQMDQSLLRKAFNDFETVVTEHGDSRYAEDAHQRLIYLRNQMARHELQTAQFYFRRSAYAATVNRIEYLIEHYERAPIVTDALALQARAYDEMQMTDLAADTRQLLAQNRAQGQATDTQRRPPDADAPAPPSQ
jgi:outer membrane protein assembly factor BamD